VRFSTHRDGLTTQGEAAYGLVPFLLFCVLREIGALEVAEGMGRASFRLASYETEDLLNMMKRCAQHAEEHVSIPELEAPTPLDRALLGARYVRARLNEGDCAAAFERVTGRDERPQPLPVPSARLRQRLRPRLTWR
jgi:hypothetical protein